MENYRKRIADEILLKKLEGKGAVLIEDQNGAEKQRLRSRSLGVFFIWTNLRKGNRIS